MGIIYQIECLETGLVYIGKTTQTLKGRFREHKCDFRNRPDKCSSYKVFKNGFAFPYVIEIVEDESKLSEREFYHIQNTDCVNYEDGRSYDKEFKKEYKKEWYKVNKKDISEEKRIKITCECGIIYSKSNKARHERSQTHIAYVKNLNK
jgi:hypothetical protein